MENTLRRLARLVARPDDEIDLAQGALLIAGVEYPDLDDARYLDLLDRLAIEAGGRVREEDGPFGAVNALSEFLFDDQRFRGNEGGYYDPRNSYLNEVLDRRLGIPITLSVVYLEVGWRLGMPVSGVGMPGHFLVRYRAPGEEIIIDPFHRGIILAMDDCRELFGRATGHPTAFRVDHLARVGTREILARMLNNLKSIYLRQHDLGRARTVVDQLLVLRPGDPEQLRERGVLRYRLGDTAGALADLEAYLAASPGAADADAVRQQVDELRDRLG